MKISNETKVGSLTVIAITVLIIGYNFLKGKDLFTNTVDYYAKYENINGIKVSNAILYNGFNVGKVTALDLNENGEVIATLTLQPNVKIPINSIAKIASQDLLGAKAIVLLFSDARTYYQEGDTLVTGFYVPSKYDITTVPKPKGEVYIDTIETAVYVVVTFYGAWTKENYEQHHQIVIDYISSHNYQTMSNPFTMRYNAPYIPDHQKRNEIAYQISNYN